MSQNCRRAVSRLSAFVSNCRRAGGECVAFGWRMRGVWVSICWRFVASFSLFVESCPCAFRYVVPSCVLCFVISMFLPPCICDIRYSLICVYCSVCLCRLFYRSSFSSIVLHYVGLVVPLACLAQSMVIVADHIGHEGHACSGYTCDGGGGQST